MHRPTPAARRLVALASASLLSCARPGTREVSSPPSPSTRATSTAQLTRAWNYTLRADQDLSVFDVELCWTGAPPRAWENRNEADSQVLVRAVDPRTGSELRIEDDKIFGGALGPDACLIYTLDLARMDESGGFMAGASMGETRVLSSSRWLWRTPAWRQGTDMQVRFDLPPGMDAAVPWTPVVAQDGSVHYLADASVFEMRSYTLVGKPRRQVFEVAGASFELVAPDTPRRLTDAGAQAWLRAAAEAVAPLFEGFPVPRLQVLILPMAAWRDDPVIFGMAARGGGSSLVLLVDATAEDGEFLGEWVAVHEMLHLGMPFVQRDDAWFSEGYATYYQQVMRARAGLLSTASGGADTQVQAAVDLLWGGISRAYASASASALSQASKQMHAKRNYRSVYWGGAAVWMAVDLGVRAATEGERSADDLVRHLHACCAAKGGVWSAEQLNAKAAQIAETWVPGGAQVVQSRMGLARENGGVPDPGPMFRELAVDPSGGNVELLSAPAKSAALRAALLSPSP